MNKKINKIYEYVEFGKERMSSEKLSSWVEYVVKSVKENNKEIEVVVDAMKELEKNTSSTIILDHIYSTRLPIESILNIIHTIMIFSIDGPHFIRSIYKDYLTKDMNENLTKIEEENTRFYKKRKDLNKKVLKK